MLVYLQVNKFFYICFFMFETYLFGHMRYAITFVYSVWWIRTINNEKLFWAKTTAISQTRQIHNRCQNSFDRFLSTIKKFSHYVVFIYSWKKENCILPLLKMKDVYHILGFYGFNEWTFCHIHGKFAFQRILSQHCQNFLSALCANLKSFHSIAF